MLKKIKFFFYLSRSYFNRIRSFIYGHVFLDKNIKSIGKNVTLYIASKSKLKIHKSLIIDDYVNFYVSDSIGQSKVFISDNVILKRYCSLQINNGIFSIGRDSVVGKGCEINVKNGTISIGNFVRIASNVFITNSNHSFKKGIPIYLQEKIPEDVYIGDDVWIGQNVIILPGVKIGEGSIIGAGSVVTKNVDPYSIYVGNPTRKVKIRD